MLTDIFISYPKRVAGVEIFFHAADNYEIRSVVVTYSKKKIIIEQCIEPVKSINELSQYIKPDIPLYLTITGKTVLSRKTDPASRTSSENLFPGLNKDEFYSESHDGRYVFLIRNKLITEIMGLFSKAGYKVAGITTGPLVIEKILKLLKLHTGLQQVIDTGNIKLTFSGYEITQFEYIQTGATQSYTFHDSEESISSAHLISYATALLPYYNATFAINEHFEELKNNRSFWNYRIFIRRNIAIFCSVLFIVLVINGFFYLNLYNKHSEVLQKYYQNESLIKRLDTLKKEIALQDKFFRTNGMDSKKGKIAFYADRIASVVPAGIRLTNMIINPVHINKADDIKEYGYDTKRIRIKGVSLKEISLNHWIKQMKDLSFVVDVAINSINKDINNETFFEIEVLLK